MSGEVLADMLARHTQDWSGDCNCSEYVLDVPWSEHVAAAVLAWLDARLTEACARGGEVAEAIELAFALVLEAEHPDRPMGGTAMRAGEDAAAAALSAVRGVLGGEGA